MTPETAGRLVFRALSNCPLNTNCDVESTAELWLDVFVDVEDSLMEKALFAVMKSVKGFPQIVDLGNAIDELRRDMITQPQPAMLSRSRKVDNFTLGVLRQLASKNPQKTKEIIQNIDVSDLMDFAKCKFPDISEQTVRNNFNEILAAKEDSDRCFACRYQPGQCTTNGYYIKPLMKPNGWVKNEYAKCLKKREVS